MRYLLLMILATVLACGGCGDDDDDDSDGGTDTDTDTGPDCTQGEYSGDFEITEQSDVAILAGYTSISGHIETHCSSCEDLSELSCLTSVGEELWLYNNTALTNLNGLSALTSVGDYLIIEGNNALTNLEGLGALTSVGQGLVITDTFDMTSLDGLSALTSVNYLTIEWNPLITNLDGLSALTSVGERLSITVNDILPDCEACDILDQLTSTPTTIEVYDNLDDSCTPVPTNCP